MTLATSPNSALPVGFRKKIAADVGMQATKHAAGVIFVAPDGDILMLRRSPQEANFGGHWALPGGGVEDGETPQIGASRETREEMGFDVDPGSMKPIDRRVTPTGTAFHTFVAPVSEKFAPKLNAEHTGYAWASLDMLPRPMHPAVEQTLREQVGMADDMKPEDWKGLREGFLKWTAEEESEPEHVATDSALRLAMDRDTVREISPEGHLHIKQTNIAKACVSPYRGEEIPNYKELGLDPQKVYQLLRDPEELARSASTFNGKPLLRKHKPTTAKDHAKDETVGALGTECVWEDPYLKNSLVIWPQNDIDDVESNLKKELSPGYRYRADMTPGNFRGTPHDGVMRDIVGNHEALVKDGRQGPDVVVGDSMENLMTKPTRLAALALSLTAASIAPLLAMDSKVVLPKKVFTDLTTKNFKDSKAALLAGVRSAIDGKLRKGLALDATMEGLAKAIDAFGGGNPDEPMEKPEVMDDLAAMSPMGQEHVQPKAYDAEPLKSFLREKGMGEDDITKACDMMPKAMAGDEDDDETKKKAAEEKKKADEAAAAKDAEMKDMVKKPAMDSAIKDAVAAARKEERGIREAIAFVRPWVGDLAPTLALDSADDVYRHAAVTLNIPKAKDIHASALPSMIEMMPKAGAQPVQHRQDNSLAMDTAAVNDFNARFPGAARIGAA